ncbi:hypothetical protein GPECTOR_61g837 [Gonium pectorale]|uniref:Tetratricopeptide SHNi-TPR domain-containing protein n=1 Tax=Gonium pectorale TaxID=33097 RepID=A0A150G4Y6_GONPE|nr:hypothetical protein GPECTOR_61g837 [Gonium pectorale]|eukprot:KXZ44884.1 hypothetical protein GPECTOR_61g837 [Gonium pectorale]
MAGEAPEAVPKGISKEELEQAEKNLQEGKKLIDDEPDRAVELLCSAVRAFEKQYGADAVECAPVYMYYGIALFEVARNSTDALGRTQTTVQQPAAAGTGQDGAGPSSEPGAAAEETKPEASAQEAAAKPSADPVPDAESGVPKEDPSGQGGQQDGEEGGASAEEGGQAGEGGEEGGEEGADGEEGEEGEGNDSDGVGSDDMKLAWEMIELSHVIYKKKDPENHEKLAEVHKALADIASEQERFDDAVELYKKSIEHMQAMQPPNKRRLAEVQYTLSVSLTYLEQPEEALKLTEAATASLSAAMAELEEKLAALPTDGSGGEAAEEEGRKLQATVDDLRSVMGELQHNCEGLRDTIKHNNSLKEALREAFMKASSLGGDPTGAVAATLSNAFSAPSKPASAAQPVSLGVVGRGTKRITLQPTAAAATQAQQPAEAGAAAAAAAPSATGKRTLGDMLNSGGPSPASEGDKAGTAGGEAGEAPAPRSEGKENAKKARTEEAV